MTLPIGILLALACAVVTNLSFFLKYRGANAAAPVDVRHPWRTARSLYSSRWFTIGMLVALGAWVLHVGALALAPISVVQVVLASGIVLMAVMAERMFGWHVGRRQFCGVALTTGGLVMLAITLPHRASHAAGSFSLDDMVAFEAGLIGLGGLLIAGQWFGAGRSHHHGVMLGAASGVLFGVSDIAIKATTRLVGAHGVLAGLATPWVLVAAGASAAAFYSSARSLQRGDAVPVMAVTAAAANMAGITGGIVVFGDPLAGNALGLAVEACAFAMVVAASAIIPAPGQGARVAPATP